MMLMINHVGQTKARAVNTKTIAFPINLDHKVEDHYNLFISLDLHKSRPLADCHYIFFSVFQYMFDHIWDLIYDSILHYQTVIQGAVSSYVLIPVNDALIKANKDKSGQTTTQYIAGAGK